MGWIPSLWTRSKATSNLELKNYDYQLENENSSCGVLNFWIRFGDWSDCCCEKKTEIKTNKKVEKKDFLMGFLGKGLEIS